MQGGKCTEAIFMELSFRRVHPDGSEERPQRGKRRLERFIRLRTQCLRGFLDMGGVALFESAVIFHLRLGGQGGMGDIELRSNVEGAVFCEALEAILKLRVVDRYRFNGPLG